MNPELRQKLDQVNDRVADLQRQAQAKLAAHEQAVAAVDFSTGVDPTSPEFKAAETAKVSYEAVCAELDGASAEREATWRLIATDGKSAAAPTRDRQPGEWLAAALQGAAVRSLS